MKRTLQRLISVAFITLMISSFFSPAPVSAQTPGLRYTVQDGDTVDSIALAFHTTANRIRQLNYIADLDVIYPGRRLIIPGFDDVQGEATKVTVPFGQSLSGYFGSLNQPFELLKRLNFITNIDQFYVGQPLFIMFTEKPAMKEIPLTSGLTGLELAVKKGVSDWAPASYNNLRGKWMLMPNTTIWLPDFETQPDDGVEIAQPLPDMTVSPYPLLQGKTTEIFTKAPPEGASLSGELTLSVNDSLGQSSNYTPTTFPVHFFPSEDGRQVALQGIHRFTRPGFASMVVTTTYADGSTYSYQQNLQIKSVDYGLDAAIEVDESFIDPTVTVPEWQMIKEVVQPAPAEKQWTYGFTYPSPLDNDWISSFGRIRSYNGSEYIYFHSGIDLVGNSSTPIFAAADGEVVFADNLDIRGGSTLISHGWGVYTGYWHQSQIDVKVGDHVTAGQTIGMVGDTGRVTGPHLHFEVIVSGVSVDPSEWLQGKY